MFSQYRSKGTIRFSYKLVVDFGERTLISDHKPSQLGMYSSVGEILEKNITIQTFSFLCHS